MGVDAAVEQAKRAFALRQYEQAVEFYATALELITEKFGDKAPETADLYFSYGRALLENAISQSSVLGKKDQPEEGADDEPAESSSNGPTLSFSGDAEDWDTAVDLQDLADDEEEVGDEAGGEGDDDDADAEPEDDFNAAWEVLDLARALYARQTEEGEDEDVPHVQLKLADTYIALGDVSLETEKFDQATNDYEAGLKLKQKLLPYSSRQIAEVHCKLSIVLDVTSGRLGDAITHAERAVESVEGRLAELADPSKAEPAPAPAPAEDAKGKGKAKATTRLVRDDVASMTPAQREAEMKELAEFKQDLVVKVEELKTRPDEPLKNAAAIVAQALDAELNAGRPANANGESGSGAQVVNDLTGMVVKKKKKPAAAATGEASGTNGAGSSPTKRKAEDDGGESGGEGKKVRLEEA
ncbi:hypothetical protein C8F04DRAFT_974078 [Mycena alexandri]|uniref:Tetratricopeptide SHNi-TPR domain-containing protein n=1 Tax=Mycena alexandri TaxID=1745969 RepID=A0AAD6S7M0_9AGAR|nr:hypothetical protein C8F04DRAFT_974078 [Mycena alexandri]